MTLFLDSQGMVTTACSLIYVLILVGPSKLHFKNMLCYSIYPQTSYVNPQTSYFGKNCQTLKEDNLSIKDKVPGPNFSSHKRFHCNSLKIESSVAV